MPPHSHEKTHFCLLLQGVYEENWGRDIFVRKPGTLALAAGGGVHSNRIHNSGIRFFSIEMTQPWLDRANGHLKHFQGLTQFDNGSLPWLAMRIYREFTSPDDLSPLAIEGLALELLAGAARHNGSSPDDQGSNWLNKARELLRERFRESITLPELATFRRKNALSDIGPVTLHATDIVLGGDFALAHSRKRGRGRRRLSSVAQDSTPSG